MVQVRVSEDGFLLQKMIHKDTLHRDIDWVKLGITKEYIDSQSKLRLSWNDPKLDFDDKREKPDPDDEEAMDRFYVTELCLPYNPPPDERDVFAYYNDIRALSGTAGYVRIRDGFVYGMKAVRRS